MPASDLVYDWNTIDPAMPAPGRHIGFDDETLRDGLQSPSVREPDVEQKIELLHLMNDLLDLSAIESGRKPPRLSAFSLRDLVREVIQSLNAMAQMHEDAVERGDRVILVDDLIATGGTAEGAVKLLRQLGAQVLAACFIIDLPDLGGADKLRKLEVPVRTLITFEGH